MNFCSACGCALASAPPVTCEACGARYWRNAKPCAGALVTRDDGAVLLVRRDHEPWRGRWDIPGGFSEFGEHPEDTAVREVHEETGLDVAVTEFVGMWLDSYPPDEITLNLYFAARLIGGTETPQPGEVAEIGWFDTTALPSGDLIAFPEHAGLVFSAWQNRSRYREAETEE